MNPTRTGSGRGSQFKSDGKASVLIDAKYVGDHSGKLVKDQNLSCYIL